MKQKLYSLFLTALLGMLGMNAWAQDLNTTEIDGITYYEISSGEDLFAFAVMVNGDAETETPAQYGINAVLTTNIDLTGVITEENPWIPIGTGGAYTGTFDGQGHAITGFEATSATDGGGLFGKTSEAVIKNFSIDGVLTSTAGTGSGVVGYPSNSTILNIHSTLDIIVPNANVHHVGGVVGSARGGNIISKCTFNGTMQVTVGSTDNFAGVVAYLGGDSVSFCANYGTISFDDTGCAAGGVAGYLNNAGSYVQNCLNMGSLVCTEPDATPKWGGAIVGRLRTHDTAKLTGNCWLEGSATGAGKDNDGKVNLTQAFCFSQDKLGTGEVCYALNGDQTVIGWYQTLGTDAQPTLDATHAQVYMAGRKHCNGDIYDGATYTNENVGVIQDEHDFVDGFCTYCGNFDENYLTPNADGFYEIATAKQLVWFEYLVNKGTLDANAVLTADIDFADLMSEEEREDPEEAQVAWTPIGDWGQTRGVANAGYKGHFDGQGHTIKNFNVTSSCNYYGIFGVISEGSLIENFDIFGTLNLGHKTGGVVGYTRDTACTIRNIRSFLTLNVTEAATTAERPGGVLGTAVNGTTNVENCTYSGILNVGGHTGNIGGIVGYINNNSAAIVNITNCLFDGEIQNGTSADGQCGGIVGYNNAGTATIKNCLSIGEIVSSEGNIGQLIGRLNGSNTKFYNNYYLGEFVNGTKSGKSAGGEAPVTVDTRMLGSGEICWKLNEETFIDPIWRQKLDEESHPTPTGNGAVVYQTPDGYDCIDPDDPESFDSFRDGIIANEKAFVEDDDLVAYQTLIDEYLETINSWEDIEDLDEFLKAYLASSEMKERIKQSAANYAKYIEACEYARNYMEEYSLEGEWATLLQNYLKEGEAVEPNDDYRRGSYTYIMENRNLDDEAILDEIVFVNQMLENAIAGGITGGTEITRLLTNSSFADGFEGWTTESNGAALASGGNKEVMPILRGLGKGSFNVAQTLTEMPNGIYMMTINGMFRAGEDVTNPFYAGQLYLNGTANYVMAPGEDVVKEEKAIPGVNCLGEDGDKLYEMDGISGWVPNGMGGCSVAYSAGRYKNFTATEVTDGNLTVGVRSLGTGLASDWLPFGNLHVYYLGTAEEADEKLTEVLQGYAKRAKVIVDFSFSDDEDDYTAQPNMSEDLKAQLEDAIGAVESCESGEDKMELINLFSDLFNQVYDCRKAYIAMFEAAINVSNIYDALLDLDLITLDEYNDLYDLMTEAQTQFSAGDYSTQQALDLVQKLNIMDNMLPSVDGVYQLSTVKELQLFAVLVNSGNNNVKAALANDIDMSEVESYEPIGTSSNPFKGEFDGQGHKITGFGQIVNEDGVEYYTLSLSGDRQGFFGYVKNATIQNFSIEGAFEYYNGTGVGVVGWSEGSTFRNIHSSLDIAVPMTSHHIAGIIGDMRDGSKAYNCSYSGTITVTDADTHDCVGGIGGYSNGNCIYENCANYGNIYYTKASCYAGGILGYINSTAFGGMKNCLNVGTIQMINGTPTNGGAVIGTARGVNNATIINNYWLKGSAHQVSGENTIPATTVTAEQLASGEVCYKLNGDQTEINWFQTLGEDTYPVLDDTHKVVYEAGDGTYVNEIVYTPGSKENPFVVKSAADLSNLINLLVSGRMNYVVMEEDVDMTDVTDWTPLFNIPDQSNGYPYIDFDGKNHVIRNLTSNTEGQYDYCGLFGVLCGNVRNLGIENANVTCTGGTGIIAGYLGHSTYGKPCYIEKVWVSGKVTANGYCGGMFGNVANEAHITNCYANVEVNGSGDLTGGIIGRVRAEVIMNNVYAAGSINLGGGIIGGGFQDATPVGTYNNIAVWNNTQKNFGPARANENMNSIIYYDGTNFADLQSQVVAWDPEVWSCDMQPGSYPVLAAFDPDGIKEVNAQWSMANGQTIFNLAGQRIQKMQKGVNIINGKKVILK